MPTGLDTEALLAIGGTETKREIAKAAASLSNGWGDVTLGRVAHRFSSLQVLQLEKALATYRGGLDPSGVEG